MDKLESGLPDTFDAALNGANHWPDIDNGVALYRLETTSFALRDSGIDEAELDRAVKAFTGTVAADKAAARTVLERVTDTWNAHRDRRPLFATTLDEIASVLDDATTESDYAMRAELVHSYLDYRPEHLARVGLVSRQMQCDLAQLRGFHLNWLRLELDRDPPQPFDTDLSHV